LYRDKDRSDRQVGQGGHYGQANQEEAVTAFRPRQPASLQADILSVQVSWLLQVNSLA
jgi:hypothetical protein